MADDWNKSWDDDFTPWHGEAADSWFWEFSDRIFSQLGESSIRVLVPLCGHSYSPKRFYEAGHSVTGVDIVPKAINELSARDFSDVEFEERELEGIAGATLSARIADRLSLVVGDFFSFDDPDGFDLIYDRAAFLALPEDLRGKYGAKLLELVKGSGLIVVKTDFWEGESLVAPYPLNVDGLDRYLIGTPRVTLREQESEIRAPHLIERGITTSVGALSVYSKEFDLGKLQERSS